MTAAPLTAAELSARYTLEELRGMYDQIETADILLHADVPLTVEAPDGPVKVTPSAVGQAKLQARGWVTSHPVRRTRRRS